MTQNFFIALIKRLKTSSPKFFRIIQIVALVIAAVAAGATFLLEKGIWTPENIEALSEVFKAITAFFSGTFFAALTTTTSAELQDDKTRQNILKDESIY